MSNVTSIILITAPRDEGIKAIQDWLDAQKKPNLVEISNYAGGNKGFASTLYAAAINYLREDLFIRVVEYTNWEYPDHLQLYFRSENDEAFRMVVDGRKLD
jgi:hypothetical protein